jgi:hypothetical protein
MLEPDIAAAIAQLGAAGLIGFMWLSERRSSAERERQLREAHDRLMSERLQIGALVELVRETTKAMAGLEAGQRRMESVLDRLASAMAGLRPGEGRESEAEPRGYPRG